MTTSAEERDDIDPKVDKDLYVNDATLELLRRRIESDVKKGFFMSIGAPIGGAGIIAILYVLFSWIPAQIGKIIESLPSIQNTVHESVVSYLGDEKKGKQFIRQQVDSNSGKYVSQAVAEYLASDEVSKTLNTEIEKRTNEYFTGNEGKKLVEGLIKTYMSSTEVRQQIRSAVDSALTPVLSSLSHDIDESLNALVYDIPQLSGAEMLGKAALESLRHFLDSPKAETIKTSRNPVVLTFTLGHGHYDRHVTNEYIRNLKDYYAMQFRYVAVLDSRNKFLALLPIDTFSVENQHDSTLINKLNGRNTKDLMTFLHDRFGTEIGSRVQTNQTVISALKTIAGRGPTMQSEFVAVVDRAGKMVGITNRQKMLDGCLDKIHV